MCCPRNGLRAKWMYSWSSDWTQPPLAHARGVTTIHDLTVLTHPESFDRSIVLVQKRRLKRALAACDVLFCDSEATLRDVHNMLGVSKDKLFVVYPGM
jgi:hypothetical protein